MSLTLREATPHDAAAVADVHVRAWQIGYRGMLPDNYLDGLRTEDWVRRYSFDDHRPDAPRTVVACEAAEVRGFVTTGPCRDEDLAGGAAVYAIYVDPRAWGTGVGRTLLDAARARLHEQGFTGASLWVLASNDRARRFYAACGWVEDIRRTDVIGGVPAELVRYRRELG